MSPALGSLASRGEGGHNHYLTNLRISIAEAPLENCNWYSVNTPNPCIQIGTFAISAPILIARIVQHWEWRLSAGRAGCHCPRFFWEGRCFVRVSPRPASTAYIFSLCGDENAGRQSAFRIAGTLESPAAAPPHFYNFLLLFRQPANHLSPIYAENYISLMLEFIGFGHSYSAGVSRVLYNVYGY